jgi:predicted RNA polymerase sigma factor
MREDRGRCLAALIARTGDFQLAEDALQDAAASALVHWGRAGVPASPPAGCCASRCARPSTGCAAVTPRPSGRAADGGAGGRGSHRARPGSHSRSPPAPDLHLLPSGAGEKTRIALTLRSLCGLTTAQVAAVFLDAEPTMGQRLSRARAKIAAARNPVRSPGPEDLPDRLNSVLTVVYLIFTAGYAAGPANRHRSL